MAIEACGTGVLLHIKEKTSAIYIPKSKIAITISLGNSSVMQDMVERERSNTPCWSCLLVGEGGDAEALQELLRERRTFSAAEGHSSVREKGGEG